ncbi:uncharacterized protein LOC142331814 [Lycorma delicatula]|uniref:uncharacterized protein LOC142331814 n=1 Tax=Lycorma delicatula TaxID=130591 RepID=UPI003F5108E0
MSDDEKKDDDDFDIYSNLPNFRYDDSLQKLETKNKQLLKEILLLEKQVAALTKELSKCKEERDLLGKNISSLYLSAKQEISRKDKQIKDLTERSISYEQKYFHLRKEKAALQNEKQYDISLIESKNKCTSLRSEVIRDDKLIADRKSSSYRYCTRSRSKKEIESVKESSKRLKLRNKSKSKNSENIEKAISLKEKKGSRALVDKGNTSASKELISEEYKSIKEDMIIHRESEVKDDEEKSESIVIKNENESSVSINDTPSTPVGNTPTVFTPLTVLPKFVGPQTTFSIRKYKQLYGVSPFKKCTTAHPTKIVSSPVSQKSSADNTKENLPKVKLFCDNNVSEKIDVTSVKVNVGQELQIVSESSEKINKPKNCLEIDNCVINKNLINTLRLTDEKENKNSKKNTDICDKSNKNLKNIHDESTVSMNEENTDIPDVSKDNEYLTVHSDVNKILSIPEEKESKYEFNVLETSKIGNKNNESNTTNDLKEKCEEIQQSCVHSKDSEASVIEKSVGNFNITKENVEGNVNKFISGASENRNDVCLLDKGSCEIYDGISEVCKKSDDNDKKVISNIYKKNNKIGINLIKNVTEKKKSVHDISDKIKEVNHKNLGSNIMEFTSSPNSCDSFTLEITNSPSPSIPDKMNDDDDELKDELIEINKQELSADKTNTDHFSTIKSDIQSETFALNLMLTPNKKIIPSMTNDNVSSDKDGKSLVKVQNNSSLLSINCVSKRIMHSTKVNKTKPKNKELQLKELFGDSPLKPDDVSSCSENASSSFNIFNNINPILSKCVDSNKILSISTFNLNDKDKKTDISSQEHNENILIAPDISKHYVDFKEAFQIRKNEIKISEHDKVLPENESVSFNNQFNKNNSINKENPNRITIQKLNSSPPTNLKNILCDKIQNSNSNISNSNDNQHELNKKCNNENDKVLSKTFSPDIFGSEIHKTSSSETNKNLPSTINALKISESSIITTYEDSMIHMIKKFSKVGDKISPIKTPCKQTDDSAEEILPTKTNIIFDISENKILHSNEENDIEVKFTKIDSGISLSKPFDKSNECKVTYLEQSNFKNISNIRGKLLKESSENDITPPTIIRKDGISVCLSSEHCEFKRPRRLRKIIKFNNIECGESLVGKKSGFETNSIRNAVSKRKCEEDISKNKINVEHTERKKRKLIVSTKKKEKDSQEVNDKEKSASLLQKRTRNKKSSEITGDHKSSKEEIIDKLRSSTLKKDKEEITEDKKKEFNEKNLFNKKLNLQSNSFHYDKKRGSIKYSNICERRSPSEYFNRQHKSRLRQENSPNRRTSRRSVRYSTPVGIRYSSCNKRKTEKKLNLDTQKYNLKKIKFHDYNLKSGKEEDNKTECSNNKNKDKKLVHSSGNSDIKKNKCPVSVGNSMINSNKSLCSSVKRLSESPNVIKDVQSLSSLKQNVESRMTWKIIPLKFDELRSKTSLFKKFVESKKIPEFISNNKDKSSTLEVMQEPIRSMKPTCSIVIRKRAKRSGERKLEDSQVLSDNITTNQKIIETNSFDEQINKSLTSEDSKNIANSSIDQDGLLKKKQLVQKTRCIVKTPLDFKKEIGDISLSSDDDQDVSVSNSSDDSQHSDESWKPTRRCKT